MQLAEHVKGGECGGRGGVEIPILSERRMLGRGRAREGGRRSDSHLHVVPAGNLHLLQG